MAALGSLETSLAGIFKCLPNISEGARKTIVSWAPWLDLAAGILSLLSLYWLWQWAHLANAWVNAANQLSASLGYGNVATTRLTVGIWLALAVVAVEAVLYLAAFTGLKAQKKSGWNLIFYGAIVNVIYGVVLLFTDYGSVGNFLGYLIGSVIALWLLFQIRPAYR